MTYYTLAVKDGETGIWFDEFGSFSRAEIRSEIEFAYDDRKKTDIRILKTDGTAGALIAALAELN